MGSATSASSDELKRNLTLIPIHEVLTGSLVWLPIFVLFTRARFDLDGALALASIYYLAVVLLEVPSGWMSDRLGRTLTLRVAALSWIAAHGCFLLGDDRFPMIAVGQVLLAGGFASLSGTDVTVHFDTLESLGRAKEFRDRQGRLRSLGLVATAVSSLVGGAVGLINLRLVFAVSLTLAVAQLVVATLLIEPPGEHRIDRFVTDLGSCVRYLGERYLGWLFFYGIVLVTLEHVAFTLMQPWLTEVLGRSPDDVGATPMFAGMVFAVTSIIAAGAARSADPLGRRFGTLPVLIGLAVVSACIVTGMALWVSAAVLILVVLRSVQGAAAPVLISAAVAPRVRQHHRATLLSLNSLAGRLGYGLILAVVSDRAADDVVRVLGWLAVVSWVMVAVLMVSVVVVPRNLRAA